MAIKDLLALADDKLHEIFHTKPHDPVKARQPIIKGIDRTHTQFHQTEPAKGKKWFKISNGVVELTLPFEIGGKSTFYVPSERFADFLAKLKDSVTGGELDKEIKAGTTGAAATPKAPAGDKPARKGWSDERRAAFQASIAARKAAKK